MTYGAGRDFLVKMGDGAVPESFATIAGMRTTSLTINNAAIDITNKDNPAWKKLLPGGIKSMAISLAGVVSDHATIKAIRAAIMAQDGSDIKNFKLVNGLGESYLGPFFIMGFDNGGDLGKDEVYTLKLESADEIEYDEA